MSNFMSPVKFDVEKFDGRINFGLWQVQVKDMLIQYGLHKALIGRPSGGAFKKASGDGDQKKSDRSNSSEDCWERGLSGHLQRDYPNRAGSAKGSGLEEANVVSLEMGDGNFL